MSLLRCDPRWSLARCACLALSCLLLLLAQAGHARAEAQLEANQASEPPSYRALVEEGLSEFSVHHFEEARALFGRAHALFPNARTHRALGLAAFELRNYVEAAHHFEAALSSDLRPLDDNLRKQAESDLERAYGFVGRVQIGLQPASARLALDGHPIALPANRVVLVRIGEHTFEAQALGYAAQKQHVVIIGGEKLEMHFDLLAMAKPSSAIVAGQARPGPEADESPRRSAWYKNPWLWTSVGIVLGGAAAGVAVAVSRDPTPRAPYRGTSDTVVKAP